MAYKAYFKTALGQREIVLDCKVAADLEVGYLCKYNADTNTLAASTSGTPAQGDYIVAQSDMTMEYGHVPVENQDHRYNPKVAASTSDTKKVAVFMVTDIADVYTKQV